MTGDHVRRAVTLAAETLGAAPDEAWDRQAGPMDCDCWDAMDHLNNGLFSYALRLALPGGYAKGGPTIRWDRPGDLPLPIITDREAGPGRLLAVMVAMGNLIAASAETAPPWLRSWHIWGVGDPEGYAAMGVVETLLHTFDIAEGLGVEWNPPTDLCEAGRARLFPEAPADTDPWETLLWASGRGDLPGFARRSEDWGWHSAPLDEMPSS